MTKRVLICGGRAFADKKLFNSTLDEIFQARGWIKTYIQEGEISTWLADIVIIEGGATGADQMAYDYAIVNWCFHEEYPANWKRYGSQAGPLRNQKMLRDGRPDVVIAFPGGRGTADMVQRAKNAGVEVIEVQS